MPFNRKMEVLPPRIPKLNLGNLSKNNEEEKLNIYSATKANQMSKKRTSFVGELGSRVASLIGSLSGRSGNNEQQPGA
jgi:hypothetical protein